MAENRFNFNTDGELVFTVDEWMLIASAVETFADGMRDAHDMVTEGEMTEDEFHNTLDRLEGIQKVIEFWLEDQANSSML